MDMEKHSDKKKCKQRTQKGKQSKVKSSTARKRQPMQKGRTTERKNNNTHWRSSNHLVSSLSLNLKNQVNLQTPLYSNNWFWIRKIMLYFFAKRKMLHRNPNRKQVKWQQQHWNTRIGTWKGTLDETKIGKIDIKLLYRSDELERVQQEIQKMKKRFFFPIRSEKWFIKR